MSRRDENGTDFWRMVDRFWMQPKDLRILDLMRRCYGFVLLCKMALLWPDRHLFFGSGSYLPPTEGRAILDPDAWSLYSFAPDSPWTISIALSILIAAGLAMILGKLTRIAAFVTFLMLIAIDHSNSMITDGEDIVIRLFAFYFIFAPGWDRMKKAATALPQARSIETEETFPAWPLRLFQLQVCLIFICSAIHKSNGIEWLNGTACYYVLRLDDLTRFILPGWISESLTMIKLTTWSVVALEMLIPFLIWNRKLRLPCLIVVLIFHLGTDFAMNLHMFQWVMLIGWMAFLRYEEIAWLGGKLGIVGRKNAS